MSLHRQLPRVDFLSFTKEGAAWIDFEWLFDLIVGVFYKAAGLGGIWFFKLGLMTASFFVLQRLLESRRPPRWIFALALALWGAGALPLADIRPDLFSLLFFLLTLLSLESASLFFVLPVLYSLWACLHPGFFAGLALFLVYACDAAMQKNFKEARSILGRGLFCAAFTVINPYGFGPHRIAAMHWLRRSDIGGYIVEWRPMAWGNPVHWGLLAEMALLAVLIGAIAARRRRIERPALAAAVVFLAWQTLIHVRMSLYFNALFPLILVGLAKDAGFWEKNSARKAGLALLAVCGLQMGALGIHLPREGPFHDKFVPSRAAFFIEREGEVFSRLRTYNPWGWGGYLGFKLSPWYKIFCDGRYIFHDEIAPEILAESDQAEWSKYFNERGLNAALMVNEPKATFKTTKIYPDGSRKPFDRPYYLFFMPREDWALVYWDEKSLVFVRRSAVPAPWLAKFEYRYVRPGDDAAFAEALRRREIPLDRVKMEMKRHVLESRLFDRPCGWLSSCAWRP